MRACPAAGNVFRVYRHERAFPGRRFGEGFVTTDVASLDHTLDRIQGNDIADKAFLDLIRRLRDVSLQDSVVLMASFPDSPLWNEVI